MEIFDTVRAELQKLIDESDATVAKSMEATEKEMEKRERLALAKVAAEERSVARGRPDADPRPIVRFLALQWIKYLVITYARDGKDSETMEGRGHDDGRAALQHRAEGDARGAPRALPASSPGLLKRLKTGVTGAGIEDAVVECVLRRADEGAHGDRADEGGRPGRRDAHSHHGRGDRRRWRRPPSGRGRKSRKP